MIKKIVIFFVCFFLLERFCYFQTGGFSTHKIITEFRIGQEIENKEENVKELLNQPFHYLGKGVQFYAFLSEDGKTVLKFIKQKHSSPSQWFYTMAGSHRKQRKRLSKIYSSCHLAYEFLKEETGLISIHLNPKFGTTEFPVTLYDNLGIKHTIDINTTSFILQKKALPLLDQFAVWQKEGAKDKAKEGINELVNLIRKRAQLGICNKDARVRNFGFIDDKIMEIDLGSFVKKRKLRVKEKLIFETTELKKWLEEYDQELSDYLTEKIQEI